MTFTNQYEPSLDVQAANSIPHFVAYPTGDDTSAGYTSGEFYVNSEDTDGTLNYLQSVFVLPIALLILGILSVIIFQIVLICRCCCRRWACCKVGETKASVTSNKITYVVFVVASFFLVHFIYIGNGLMNSGVSDTIVGFDSLSTLFTGISDVGTGCQTVGADILASNNAVEQQCCSGACGSGTPFENFYDAVDAAANGIKTVGASLYDTTSGIPDKLDLASSYLTQYGQEAKSRVVYCFYAVIAFFNVLLLAAGLSKNKCLLQTMIFFTEIIVIILTIVSTILMIPVTLFGDYCMSPNDNIVNIFSSGFIHDTLSYYLTCTGNDLIGNDLVNAIDFTKAIDDAMDTLRINASPSGLCNDTLNYVSTNISKVAPALDSLTQYVQCPSLNKIWYEIVNVGLCGDSFSGFFEIWLVIISTNTLLFVSMCIASVMFVQFDVKFEDPDAPAIEVIDEFGNGEYVIAPSAPSHPGGVHVEMVAVDSNKKAEYNLYGVVV